MLLVCVVKINWIYYTIIRITLMRASNAMNIFQRLIVYLYSRSSGMNCIWDTASGRCLWNQNHHRQIFGQIDVVFRIRICAKNKQTNISAWWLFIFIVEWMMVDTESSMWSCFLVLMMCSSIEYLGHTIPHVWRMCNALFCSHFWSLIENKILHFSNNNKIQNKNTNLLLFFFGCV